MSDSRFHMSTVFRIYGQRFAIDQSLNWSAEAGQCDERISQWFASCHDVALMEFVKQQTAIEVVRKAKEEEATERAELARLREKYPDA